MGFKIGFCAEANEKSGQSSVRVPTSETSAPRKSVVQVYFSARDLTLSYYNDQFDLHRGDYVFVDGKLEGLRGRILAVNYNFKIDLSKYKRVIAKVDVCIHGKFHMTGSHFITFDPAALPVETARSWFLPPQKEDTVYATGKDDFAFPLDDPSDVDIPPQIVERGQNYYEENRVCYLCVNGSHFYAIVQGSRPYEVEFDYASGMISDLTCSCFCTGVCKHMIAAILQLKEALEEIRKNFAGQFEESCYFAQVLKTSLFTLAVDGNENGSFIL